MNSLRFCFPGKISYILKKQFCQLQYSSLVVFLLVYIFFFFFSIHLCIHHLTLFRLARFLLKQLLVVLWEPNLYVTSFKNFPFTFAFDNDFFFSFYNSWYSSPLGFLELNVHFLTQIWKFFSDFFKNDLSDFFLFFFFCCLFLQRLW